MTKTEIRDIIKEWNILFVDDEEFVVESMKEILPILFKKAYFAINGLDGIEICNNHKVDIVMTDLSMPKMNGLDMIKKIKQKQEDLKIICVSGHNEKEFIDEASKLKAVFIIKPINFEELYKALEKICLNKL